MLASSRPGDRRRRPSDDQLAERAAELSAALPRRPRPAHSASAGSTNQNSRWGSCTPSDGTIRISARVKGMPSYVLDYVILHELAHLLAPGHGRDFWRLLESYPRTERARGYLEGVAAAARPRPRRATRRRSGESSPAAPDDVEDRRRQPSAS